MEDIPQNILEKAAQATERFLPIKSRGTHDREYKIFLIWKDKNTVTSKNETVMLAYFQEMKNSLQVLYGPNIIFWDQHFYGIDISTYNCLLSFLKMKSKGYVAKKSKVLKRDQIFKFMKNEFDGINLLDKGITVMGIFGGLRREEIVNMLVDYIEYKGSVLLVKIPVTKTSTSKSLTVVEDNNISALKLAKKYAAIRPTEIEERRFFFTYRHARCTKQPVGKNTIGSVHSLTAKYLNSHNWKEYTSHCLRRTSSTLLVGAGATFEMLKMHGKWKSPKVAGGFIEETNFYFGENI